MIYLIKNVALITKSASPNLSKAIYRTFIPNAYRGRRKKANIKRVASPVIPKGMSPVIKYEESLIIPDLPLMIKSTSYLSDIETEKLSQEFIDEIVAEQVNAISKHNNIIGTPKDWKDFPLSDPKIKFLIIMNTTIKCKTPLSSWDITRAQTAGVLSKVLYDRNLDNYMTKHKIDSVEWYLMNTNKPKNLHLIVEN